MEMTKGKIGTPKAPLADMRLTRSPKFNDYNVPASSACVPCLLPGKIFDVFMCPCSVGIMHFFAFRSRLQKIHPPFQYG